MKNNFLNMIEIFEKAMRSSGDILKKYYQKASIVTQKSSSVDFCTEADLASEQNFLKIIEESGLNFNLYAEESGKKDNGADLTLIVDPLDGTHNYSLGIPNFTIAAAIFNDKTKKIEFGMTYAPMVDELFFAEKSKGFYRNHNHVTVDKTLRKFSESVISYVQSYKISREEHLKIMQLLNQSAPKRILNNWSSQYDFCLLASGKIDAVFLNTAQIYDFTAGRLFVEEAGGVVKNLNGDNDELNDRFIAANTPELLEEFLAIVTV